MFVGLQTRIEQVVEVSREIRRESQELYFQVL
ncbi:hypothetical protein Goari_014337 [Gossypium aridum]|uniref:Uncharacterized protein n=1 Tax=Gossypium aridum TaxID=34290 RepID=A0A7J8XHH4_GOSAI|nr:hypothetical protein [Gossypium aridum]